MKKLILFFIALSICVSLVACETTEPDLDNTPEPSNTGTPEDSEGLENPEPTETTLFTGTVGGCYITQHMGSIKDLEKYIYEGVTDIEQYDYPQKIDFYLDQFMHWDLVKDLKKGYISLEYVFGIDEDMFFLDDDEYNKLNNWVHFTQSGKASIIYGASFSDLRVALGVTKSSDIVEYLKSNFNLNDECFVDYNEIPNDDSKYRIRSFDHIYVSYSLVNPYEVSFIANGYLVTVRIYIPYKDQNNEEIVNSIMQRFFEDERTAHLGKLFSDNYDEAKEAVDNIITNIRNAKSQKEIVN